MQIEEERGTVHNNAAGLAKVKNLFLLFLLVAVLATAIWLFRGSVGWPVASALEDENGAKISVYRNDFISTSEIVFDIVDVDYAESPLGMTRKLLKAADALKEHNFERVFLAHRGEKKFYLDGYYFQRLGRERSWQNPIYTIRTLPENVMRLDGSPAYGSWTGGWIGVMGRQLEDANQFHRDWWLSDEISGS